MMKSKVCTMTNALVKKGYTKSAAFTKAWALVKAEAVNERMHRLSLSSDRYNRQDRELASRLSVEYGCLMSKANSIHNGPEIIPPTEEEKAILMAEMTRLLNTEDWETSPYSKLWARHEGKIAASEVEAFITYNATELAA